MDINEHDTLGNHGIIWISDEFHSKINLMSDNKTIVRRQMTIWIRRALMRNLQERCARNEDGNWTTNGRKDMEYISQYIDRGATMANFSEKKSSLPYGAPSPSPMPETVPSPAPHPVPSTSSLSYEWSP